jgi:hypothetical protein
MLRPHGKLKPKKSTTKSKTRSTSRRRPTPVRELEDLIVSLAESGQLPAAGRQAARETRAAGLPLTYKRGNQIVREHPGGRREVLETLPPAPPFKRPKGVKVIRRRSAKA